MTSKQLNSVTVPNTREMKAYRVLARKYRPVKFSELIGQEVLVRILTNAFKSNRVAHAFILTGVRGIGKTTTARIIARALNCSNGWAGSDLEVEPCGICEHCEAIGGDRHVDVLEMDAASRTGVEDVRELIESVRYLPVSARYKVYIIDEVHMLSKNAFNALLKTLEEPPAHVKFIFATTDLQKVPITVLSRCQRFDLNRVDADVLVPYFSAIAAKEGVKITESALHLIARAADGSVRDGLSLVDQAISHLTDEISETDIREMLGLTNRLQTFHLLELIFGGEIGLALKDFDKQYQEGAMPLNVIEDMLEIVNFLTRLKINPSMSENLGISDLEKKNGDDLVKRLSMASLTRVWQMLLKGLSEARIAPSSKQAADMVLVRLAYASNLPTPEEIISSIEIDQNSKIESAEIKDKSIILKQELHGAVSKKKSQDRSSSFVKSKDELKDDCKTSIPETIEEVLALLDQKREALLRTHLLYDLSIVRFEPGCIELNPRPNAPSDLTTQLSSFLNKYTSRSWSVQLSNEKGQLTLHEKQLLKVSTMKAQAEELPLVKAVLKIFPDSTIEEIEKMNSPEMGTNVTSTR